MASPDPRFWGIPGRCTCTPTGNTIFAPIFGFPFVTAEGATLVSTNRVESFWKPYVFAFWSTLVSTNFGFFALLLIGGSFFGDLFWPVSYTSVHANLFKKASKWLKLQSCVHKFCVFRVLIEDFRVFGLFRRLLVKRVWLFNREKGEKEVVFEAIFLYKCPQMAFFTFFRSVFPFLTISADFPIFLPIFGFFCHF